MSGPKEPSQNRQRGLFTFLVSGIIIFITLIIFINNRKSLTASQYEEPHTPEDQLLVGTDKGVDRSAKAKEMIQQNRKKSAEKHFLRTDVIEKNACLATSGSAMYSESIYDNKRTFVPVIVEIDSFKNFQLCLASSGDHEHTIKVFLEHVSEGDCDMYLSASEDYPSQINWNWKSNNPGDDSVTLSTSMEEFKKAGLNALFIAVTGKQTMNECKLNIEVSPVTSTGSLRA